MQKYIIGNWKLNPATHADAITLTLALKDALMDTPETCCVGIAPSLLYLSDIKTFAPYSLVIGVQDIAHKTAQTGAFTGDVSACQVANMGAKFTLVGHSERRQYHGEGDEVLSQKIRHAFDVGLSVIYCIGETKEEYERGDTEAVLEAQLELLEQFAKDIPFVEDVPFPKLIIAYEPVWAIGTGLTPTLDEIDGVHNFISEILSTLEVPAPIIYGGSVNDKNAPDIAKLLTVDGVLVGGASLKADSFTNIVRAFG